MRTHKEDRAMRKVWIEAALNGPWSRALQPGLPDMIEAILPRPRIAGVSRYNLRGIAE
jgi:hypothetical protein